jgi:hypothetical protein
MAEPRPTYRGIAAGLTARGLLGPASVKPIAEALERPIAKTAQPAFVQALIGVGAWLAGLCFTAFLTSLLHVATERGTALFCTGAAWIFAAAIVFRTGSAKSIFFRQLALAFSVAGHALVFIGLDATYHRALPAQTATAVLLCGLLYRFYPDNVHRFLSSCTALGFLTVLCVEGESAPGLHALACAEALECGLIFLHRLIPGAVRPMGYACALGAVGTLALICQPLDDPLWRNSELPVWPASVYLGLLLLALWACLGAWPFGAGVPEDARRRQRNALVLAALGTLALALLNAPGLLLALGLLAIAFATTDRVLMVLGLLALPAFLSLYYYSLAADLMTKSIVLAGSGAVCLFLRILLGRIFPRELVETAGVAGEGA